MYDSAFGKERGECYWASAKPVFVLVILLLALFHVVGHCDIVISGVPEYEWFHGCANTSGGMMIGYWDAQPGYGDLFDGDASTWWGNDDGSSGTKHMVASKEFINGTAHNDNCIGDFMFTTASGNTYDFNMFPGLRYYADWDDPNTSVNESHAFYSNAHYTGQGSSASFSWEHFAGEIDDGRPMLLDMSLDGARHAVVAYGYQDNGPGDRWFAVRDTWVDGDSNGQYGIVAKMEAGTEWWKWIEQDGMSPGNDYYVSAGMYFGPESGGWVSEAADHNSSATAQELPLSGICTVDAAISAAGEEDWYSVYLGTNDTLVLSTSDTADLYGLDTEIELLDPTGSSRDSNRSYWLNSKSHIEYTADAQGWWQIVVTAWGTETGDYDLSMNRMGDGPPIPEPGTFVVFVSGLVALAFFWHRRNAEA